MASDNQNISLTSFLNIPGAVQITGLGFLEYEPPGHPIFIAPEMPWYLTPTTIKIPLINFNDLVNLLDGILANVDKIEINKKYDWCYSIEYHPVDGIKMYPRDPLHQIKKISMFQAVSLAFEKFPHLEEMWHENFDENFIPPPLRFDEQKEWFEMEVRIYYCSKQNCYVLEFNRMRGEAGCFYKVFRQIKAQIEELLPQKNYLWLMRKNYLNLLEGTKFNINNETQITRYLLNELLAREICSYIGFEPLTN